MLKEISKEQANQSNLTNSVKILLSKQKGNEITKKHQQKKLLFLTDFDKFRRMINTPK